MARATEGGGSGAAPENAGAVAAGQAAAEAAPTVADGDAPQSKTVVSNDAPVSTTTSTETNVEAVGNAVVADPVSPDGTDGTDPDGEGGKSFDYGFKDDESREAAEDAVLAQKVAAHDAALRQENPDGIVYREAGSAGAVGGESFDYGQKPSA